MNGRNEARALPARPLLHLLTDAAQSDRGITFVDRRGQEVRHTYAALLAGAQALATTLTALGVRSGDRVAFVLPTGAHFLHALFATQALGAVAVPLYPPVRLARLDEYLARTQAMLTSCSVTLVLTTHMLAGLLAPALRATRLPLGYFALDAAPGAHQAACAPSLFRDVDPDAVALLQFSSGTTAAPKAVALTHRQIGANVATIAHALYGSVPSCRPDGKHTTVSWLPLYHDMGLMGSLLTSVFDATDAVLLAPESFVGRPVSWLQALSRHKATISAAPNFAYALCTARIRDEDLVGVDLSHWQVALNGAEAVSMDTMRAFAKRFARVGFRFAAFAPVYGLAESVLAVTFSRLDRSCEGRHFSLTALRQLGRAEQVPAPAAHTAGAQARELVSVGRPLAGYAVRIVRTSEANGEQACAAGEVGRVQVRGPSLMAGYWPLQKAPGPLAASTWLDSGDLGFLLAEELYLVGRQKDVLVVRGQNYAPDELERAVDDEPQVRTGCSIAGSVVRAGSATEAVVLLVELRRPNLSEAGKASLRLRLGQRVAQATGLKLDELALLAPGTLPRTSSGKKRRGEAMLRYQLGTLHAPAQPGRLQLLRRALTGRMQLWWAAGKAGNSAHRGL